MLQQENLKKEMLKKFKARKKKWLSLINLLARKKMFPDLKERIIQMFKLSESIKLLKIVVKKIQRDVDIKFNSSTKWVKMEKNKLQPKILEELSLEESGILNAETL